MGYWEVLCCEGGGALTQIAQRNCGSPMPGSIQGQFGWTWSKQVYWKVSLPVAVGLEWDGL